MGEIKNHHSVKLIIGFIYKDKPSFDKAKAVLIKKFGPIDFESRALSFCHSDYYEKEFGKNLTRSFISFKKLISPEKLPAIKVLTNTIEKKLSVKGSRFINIDPGYLDLAKLILASTKDFFHRIYLGKGILAETTLVFQNKTFRPLEWTYPDYKSIEYIEIFNYIRHIYETEANHG
jgi:hypothetical protein